MSRYAVTFAAFLFGLALSGPARAQAYDYCASFPDRERVTIILDRSAPYATDDVERLHRGLDALRKRLESGLRDRERFKGFSIEVRPVTSYTATSGPMFRECAPTCPTNISIWDSCREQDVVRDRKAFWNRLDEVFAPAQLTMAQISQGETPLAEVIARAVRESAPHTLVVFSDFLEHHAAGNGLPRVSLYAQNAGEMAGYIKALKRTNVLPDLRGVTVVGYGLGSELGGPSKLQARPLGEGQWRLVYQFWVSFFQEAGAQGISLEREYPGVTPPPPPPPPPPQDRGPLK